VLPIEFEQDNVRTAEFKEFLEEAHHEEGWRSRLKVVGLDVRSLYPMGFLLQDGGRGI